MEIITRKDAIAQGLKHYFTSKPCKNGHIAPRFVSNSRCSICLREYKTKWRQGNKEKTKAQYKRDNAKRHDKEYKESQNTLKTEIEKAKKEALQKGLPTYNIKNKCVNGHLSPRRIYDDKCCKCVHERQKKYKEKNKEKTAEDNRIWRKRNKESQKQYHGEYYQNNRDYLIEKQKENDKKRRPKIREYNKKYQKIYKERYPERLRNQGNKKYARRKKAKINTIASTSIKQMLISQNYKCNNPHCQKDISTDYHIDHIVPIVTGGEHKIENLQLLCPFCNCSKGAKDWGKWLLEQREESKELAYAK